MLGAVPGDWTHGEAGWRLGSCGSPRVGRPDCQGACSDEVYLLQMSVVGLAGISWSCSAGSSWQECSSPLHVALPACHNRPHTTSPCIHPPLCMLRCTDRHVQPGARAPHQEQNGPAHNPSGDGARAVPGSSSQYPGTACIIGPRTVHCLFLPKKSLQEAPSERQPSLHWVDALSGCSVTAPAARAMDSPSCD